MPQKVLEIELTVEETTVQQRIPRLLFSNGFRDYSSATDSETTLQQRIPRPLFSKGFRDYHFRTISHRKGVSGNESYERISGVLC
ncbi:hypothetical protein AVEN_7012-1 [Araneus ventricosus]|uniref:Uncharacterized protein n=1 Tax=Araneus ventricosus TaxID=182803 RepID=A0A4Y2IEH2_ARAVE|nr:hypothetical protein AVEN_7012-1 [Araneus ventricosus]